MSPLPPVVLYRYDASPFSVKIDNVLLLKNIPFRKVNVSSVLPRPEITDLLGISYRRIPILAIGNDVYCDTSLIASALERRFPTSAGYGTIFPARKHGGGADTGIVKAFSKYYADTTLFPLAPSLLPWEKFPSSFVQDRSLLTGAPMDVQKVVASRDKSVATLASHLALVEEQLSDGREWLFDTELPNLADVSIHFIYNWLKQFRTAQLLLSAEKFPYTLKWLAHMSAFIEKKKTSLPAPQQISGDEAAALIMSSGFEPHDVVGFDSTEAARLGLKIGEVVQIAPDDTGRNYPTSGKLVSLNKEEVVLEVTGSKGLLHCHFPRLSFTVRPTKPSKL